MRDEDNENTHSSTQADAFADALRGSARQIWLAGLGALGRAQREGGKLFETLAQEGAALQDRLQPTTQARFERARHGVAGLAAKASERVDALLEDRVTKALDRLDVPLGSEVDALAARVAALEHAVAALSGPKPAPRRRPPVRDQDRPEAPRPTAPDSD